MSTEVATPLAPVIPTTTEETPILAPVVATGETKPQVEGGSSPSDEVPASEPTPVVATEEQPTTPTKEEHKKRSPFGDLKNKLFHKTPSQPTSPTTESSDPVKEVAPTPAPAVVVEDEAAKENSAPETTPAVATEETPATTETPVVAEEKPEKKEKVKTPLFEKVKSFFGDAHKEKKEKKVKTPTEEKSEPSTSTSAPQIEAPSDAAPVLDETPAEVPTVDVTSPEAVAVAEAQENAAAPVPQIIDTGSPKADPTPEEAQADIESVKPVAVEEPTTPAPAAAETEEGVKFDEAAKTENKPPKKDLAKLGRRLSARLGAVFHSPKKEKTEAEAAPVVAATEEPAQPEASTSAAVEETPKVGSEVAPSSEETAVAPKVEEPTLPTSVEEPTKAEEPKTTEEVVAPVDAPGDELAAEVKKTEAETPAVVAATA